MFYYNSLAQPAHAFDMQMISQHLLLLLPDSPTWKPTGSIEAIVQVASSLIDIFSDENSPWDINFRKGKWETRLKVSIDGVRRAVRVIDKRKEGGRELRRRGDEVVENLAAFVKYRKRLML